MSCQHLPLAAPPFQLVLPGGAELLGVDLGAVAPPALAPLVPLFRIADLVVKVADLVAALPDAVALPPNPGPLLARVPAVARAAAELGLVMPPASVPALAVSLLDALVREVRGMRGRLGLLDAQEARIARAREGAVRLQSPMLLDAAACADENLALAVAAIIAPFEVLRGVLGLLGLLLGAAGGAPLPPIALRSTTDRTALVADLVALEQELVQLQQAVPR